ncbi:MarR family winged helix-turn-helix transcriptional regulator [Kineococcus aurantiacus]|uniref:DNA-binding MarR family transcriptional regulator n=1 Tax=Kineococcus aurantiacus TaxID=37633 RepID=A0A7Y9DJQ7_9ACTN|nr:MarR family transcriptional regulator [Kineococcus aurantiacus]NYD21433.1 DNA-binding MarR family transcriptional regulator [Kineococcus aurantiacus]
MPPSTEELPTTGETAGGTAVDTAPLDRLAVDLRVSLLRTARRLRAQKSVDELTDGQFSVLSQLFTTGPRTPGELAEAEHVRPPSMTRTIAGLVEAGLVERTDHPDDGRQVLVSATDAGRAVVVETRERRAAWLSRRLEGLSPAERATLAEAARILTAVIAE